MSHLHWRNTKTIESISRLFFWLAVTLTAAVHFVAILGHLVFGVSYLQAAGASFIWLSTAGLFGWGAHWGLDTVIDKYLAWKASKAVGGEA